MVEFTVRILNLPQGSTARVVVNNALLSYYARYDTGNGVNFYAGPPFAVPFDTDILIDCPGFAPYSYFAATGKAFQFGPETINLEVSLTTSFKKPSRDQIVNVKANLCNLRDADDIPIFDIFIATLIRNGDYQKANDWIARLKAAGTHINLAISYNYAEPLGWINQYPISGYDFTNDIFSFSMVLDYVIQRGLIPIVKLATDGLVYDPVGWTYGWQWGIDNLPFILPKLGKYWEYCLWSTGFDGCFPTWSPDQLLQMIRLMRAILGESNCIDTEFSGPAGETWCYTHLGNGAADWTKDKLGILDHFSLEALTCPVDTGEGLNQVATRLLGPKCLIGPTSPYYLIMLDKYIGIDFYETNAYTSIRKQSTPQQAINLAAQGKGYGFSVFGNGVPF